MKRVCPLLLVPALLAVFPALAFAGSFVLGTEDPGAGFVGALATLDPDGRAVTVGSDSEVAFDPFGFGADTSDGIVLPPDWLPDTIDTPDAFAPGFWTKIAGTNTWVLPASTPAGSENEPSAEPVAKWFLPFRSWDSSTPNPQVILDADGRTVSDVITVDNSGPQGFAAISFRSDAGVVPEPASLTLLALGVAGLAATRLRKKSA
jgi:hypothetical protein